MIVLGAGFLIPETGLNILGFYNLALGVIDFFTIGVNTEGAVFIRSSNCFRSV